MNLKKVSLIMIGFMLLCGSIIAANAELNGQEILDQMKDVNTLTGTGMATINLITENKQGQQRSNKIKIYREVEDQVEKQLIEYLDPADVEGTKFLSINNKETGEDQMWLFMPALGRERRVAGHNTQDKFMNTDFTFEEIGGSKNYNQDYQAERLADAVFNDYQCYVLALTPVQKDSDYDQIKMWIWQEEMMALKLEFYNQDQQLTKKLTLIKLKQNENEEYVPEKVVLSDELKGTKTIIEILESCSKDVRDDYFTLKYLRR